MTRNVLCCEGDTERDEGREEKSWPTAVCSCLRQVCNEYALLGEIIKGSCDNLVGNQVEITIAATDLGRGGVEATPLSQVVELGEDVWVCAARLQPTPFILAPKAASFLGVQPFGRPHSKVLGPRSIVY